MRSIAPTPVATPALTIPPMAGVAAAICDSKAVNPGRAAQAAIGRQQPALRE